MNCMKLMNRLPLALALTFCTLTGCGGGGGGGATGANAQPTGNLRIGAVQVETDELQAGHEVELKTTVVATEEFQSVPVTYTLLNRADVDAEKEEVRQHILGDSVIDTVEAGTSEHSAVVTIPEQLRSDNEWFLVAQVDPANVIPETDEEDNTPTDESRVAVRIGNQQTDKPDLVIETATFEEDAVVLERAPARAQRQRASANDIKNVDDHDFSATLVLTTTGAKVIEGVDRTAFIDVPGLGKRQLGIWEVSQERHLQELLVDVQPGIPNDVHLDLRLPARARAAIQRLLQNGGEPSFDVEIRVNSSKKLEEYEAGVRRYDEARQGEDNIIRGKIVVVLPPPPPVVCQKINFNNRFRKNFGARNFSVGVDLRGRASLDERGAIAQTNATIPVRVFGRRFEAAKLTSFAGVLPGEDGSAQSQFDLDFRVFNVTLFSESATDPEFTFEQELSFTRSIDRNKLFFVGPIPIQVRGVASGTLGFANTVTLSPTRVSATAAAFGSLDGTLEASVSLIIVKAGVGGSITLIEDRFEVTAACELKAPSNSRLEGELSLTITNDLQGPRGRLFLFAEFPVLKFCFRIIPCGFRQKRKELTLIRFRSFRKVDVLFQRSQTANVCLSPADA